MSIRNSLLTVFASVIATATPPAQTPEKAPAWSPTVERLQTPAAPDSGQPQLSTSKRGIMLSWVERQGQKATLRFSERTPNGWSPPCDAASGNDWFVNWADVPSVDSAGATARWSTHWLQKSGPGHVHIQDVRLSHSKDDGKTWSPSFTPQYRRHKDGARICVTLRDA